MLRKLALLVVTALFLGSLPGIALAAPPKPFTPGAAGIGDPYYPLDGNGGYEVGHYDLNVSYDPATDRLTGIATITARATQDLSAFNLDFVGLKLRSITVNGVAAVATRKGGELTVKPKTGLPNGSTFTVVARYDGVPETLEEFGLSGFIHTGDGAIAIGEPHVAATWFPANDHPRDKASFTFHISVPAGLEAISNGVLTGQATSAGWTTWTWDAVEPMTTYLAFMSVGEFEVRAYQKSGLKYWDAVDTVFTGDRLPAVEPIDGAQFLSSGVADVSFKRLTHTLAVPAGGANLSFKVDRDTEPDWDFLFVEMRTAGADDWTTLPDLNGHTSQNVGFCPYSIEPNPFMAHYLTPYLVDPGDPSTPDDDFYSCNPTGTTGVWNAASGTSGGWEDWSVTIPNPSATAKQIEVSISYASDWAVQLRGVALDAIVVSTGQGTTSFEADGNVLDGWVAPLTRPDGDPPNENTWTTSTFLPPEPNLIGANAFETFDHQPAILDFEAKKFGPYPFSAAGGVVDEVGVGFALENQTRPTYSPFFFDGGGVNDFVVVHELAHQWFGDSLAVDAWQHIWLNEGFATYAEWLWSEDQGFGTAEENYESWDSIPADDEFWQLPIGDPGTGHEFDFQVYGRGAMTLHALRREVGDGRFFRILREWTSSQAGGNVTTSEFIALAERISHKDLDPLFAMWLGSGKPDFGLEAVSTQRTARSSAHDLPAASRNLVERLKDRAGQPFHDVALKPMR